MKQCVNLSCVTCGFRFWPETVIKKSLKTIDHPIQIVCSAGRAKGFRVVQYVPWSELSRFRDNVQVWRAVNCEYIRLASAYDNFHLHLGFLSPRILEIMESLNSEILRLRIRCKELQDQLDRLLVTQTRRADDIGEFGRVLEEISRREEEDRRSDLDLIK